MSQSYAIALFLSVSLAGCAALDPVDTPPDAVAPVPTTVLPPPPPPPPDARTVEQFDTTTEAEREAALATPAVVTQAELGTTIATLGSPTDPGIWISTPLVDAVMMGRVEYADAGTSVTLELRPSGGEPGSGSQISLAAMRLLNIPLTALAEVTVFRADG